MLIFSIREAAPLFHYYFQSQNLHFSIFPSKTNQFDFYK